MEYKTEGELSPEHNVWSNDGEEGGRFNSINIAQMNLLY